MNVLPYIGDAYKTETIRKMYSELIMPLPHPSDWVKPRQYAMIEVNPPDDVRQAGRPKQRRHTSSGEVRVRGSVQRCKRCRQIGHNQVRCTVHIPTPTPIVPPLPSAAPECTEYSQNARADPNQVSQEDEGRARRDRKCSICQGTDHTRRTCPNRGQNEGEHAQSEGVTQGINIPS